jgi:hypothetical protein
MNVSSRGVVSFGSQGWLVLGDVVRDQADLFLERNLGPLTRLEILLDVQPSQRRKKLALYRTPTSSPFPMSDGVDFGRQSADTENITFHIVGAGL